MEGDIQVVECDTNAHIDRNTEMNEQAALIRTFRDSNIDQTKTLPQKINTQ